MVFRYLVELTFFYLTAFLFGTSLFGIILVEPSHIPWIIVAVVLSAWLVWRVHNRLVVMMIVIFGVDLFQFLLEELK